LRPPINLDRNLAIYYAIAYLIFDSAATFVYMPYFALTPELTNDYDERTTLTTYRMFFSILGSLIAFTIPLTIIGGFSPENTDNVLKMGIIFGIVSIAPLLLTFFGTKEQKDFMNLERPKLLASLKAAFKNRPFLFGAAIFLLTWVSVDILQTALLYFIKYIVVRESQSDMIMGAIFVTAIIALPIWEFASRRWSKRWAYVGGIAFWAIVQLVLITLDSSTPLSILYTLCVLAGIGVSAAHVLPWSILPDAIEWDEYQTGQRHEGMFYSLITLMQKVASSIAVPLALLVLQITGYEPNAILQKPKALTGIRIIIGPIPAILLSCGIIFAILYPLNRKEFNQVKRKLEIRRAVQVEVSE